MKTQSAKAGLKGRNLQKWVVNKLIETFEIHPEDIKSCSMGAGGEDVVQKTSNPVLWVLVERM